LPITVLKTMTSGELLADFNNTVIQPLSGIYTLIGGLFQPEDYHNFSSIEL
jgi:hypothetical protein